jgi:hypothetical protein
MKKHYGLLLVAILGTVSLAYGVKSRQAIAEAQHAKAEKEGIKYICAREIMDDSVLMDEYPTKEECKKYCYGIGTVCQKTSKKTSIYPED